MTTITGYTVEDLRFPSQDGEGSDATNTECDYSSAYVTLLTDGADKGVGMTFTIGRGQELVCLAIERIAERIVGKKTAELFGDMGAAWTLLCADPQLRWVGPEKGVIHLATAAVVNALWDMYARHEKKPLWKLIYDFTPEEFVKSTAFRYCTDAITPQEALEMLREKEKGKKERLERMQKEGYPAYVTSAGWLGYPDDKVARLTKEAIASGFNHFKMKVGVDVKEDARRLALVRSIIDDPEACKGRPVPRPETLVGKNAGPTGSVLMIDANQIWDVQQAVEYVKELAPAKPWFIEEPTAPDDILGHANIRRQLKPYGVGVATGEHAHNRMVFKQLLQAEAIDVCQIDSCRLAGVNEVLAVLLMAAKFGVPVCPHAGGVGLCEYVIHLSLIDYLCVSGSIDVNVLEFVDHLHEHFETPCSINSNGHYNVPNNPNEGYSIEIKAASKDEFRFPDGRYWSSPEAKSTKSGV